MHVFFRADSSSVIGTGHIVRCLTLAKKLRDHGAITTFICRNLVGNCSQLIQSPNSKHMLENTDDLNETTNKCFEREEIYSAKIQNLDAEECISIIKRKELSDIVWIVVDHYAIDSLWESHFYSRGYNVLVIDDLANRQHKCSILLDQNLYPNYQNRYLSKLDNKPKQLLGTNYALLRDDFSEYRPSAIPKMYKKNNPLKALIYFGGVDANNITLKVIESLKGSEFKHVEFGILVGIANPNKEVIAEYIKHDSKLKLIEHTADICKLMKSYSCIVGASGTTTWERFCLGIPSAVISIAKNQTPIAEHLDRLGAIYYIGYYKELTHQTIADKIKLFLQDVNLREKCAQTGFELVDGKGTERVANQITSQF